MSLVNTTYILIPEFFKRSHIFCYVPYINIPFITKIEFQIPVSSFVELKVFDLLGKEVAALVNEEKNPGNYATTFDGAGLASGVYFYCLKTGEFFQTRKLLLLK